MKKKRPRRWTHFRKAVHRTVFSKWLVMSRNGAPIGINPTFTSIMPQEISRPRRQGWAASFAAAIACARTNSNFAAQCAAQTRQRLQTSF